MKKTIPSLQLSTTKQSHKIAYDFLSVELTNSPDGKFNKEYAATVEKKFIKKDQHGNMFSVSIIKDKQNLKENIEFEEVVDFLQEEIILYTDTNGEIKSILNRSIVKENWQENSKKVRKFFIKSIPNIDEIINGINEILDDEIAFLNFIKKSSIYNLLFPPVFDIDLQKTKSVVQKKRIQNFFEHNDLPLIVNTSVVALNVRTNGLQIVRNGKLDTYDFNKEAVSDFFLKSYGIHKSNLSYGANLIEYYDLDSYHNIDKANGFLNVEVPNVFRYRRINKLIQKN